IPLERLIFAEGRVVAHHRTALTFLAKAEFYGRLRADAGKIYGTMSGAGYARNTGVERLVENNSDIAKGPRTRQACQHEHEQKRNQKCSDSPLEQSPARREHGRRWIRR